MMMKWKVPGRGAVLALGLATLALGACDGREPTGAIPDAARPAAPSASLGDRVARALAAGLADEAVRLQVRDAMRASPLNEHKLVLQEFASTAAGQALVQASAAAAGVDAATLAGWIRQLPAMDFYVPVLEHRLSWTGSADVVLGLNLDVDDTSLTAYGTDGAVLQLDRRDGVPARAVLILHPAEPTWNRPQGATRRAGSVIQDADESTASMAVSVDAGQPLAAAAGTYFTLISYRAYFTDGWGDNEVMFKHYSDQMANTKVWEWITSGYYAYETAQPHKLSTPGLLVRVWERDSGAETGGDDYQGGGWIKKNDPVPSDGWHKTWIRASCNPRDSDGLSFGSWQPYYPTIYYMECDQPSDSFTEPTDSRGWMVYGYE